MKDGWKIVKFGEIAREIRLTTQTPIEDGLEFYVGLEHLDPQSLRIQRKGIIAEDNPSFTRAFKAGQILFGKRRSYQKKAAVADFDGWQNSVTGEREIQKVLRQTLFKYKLHKEQELFDKAYGYIREHY